MFTMSSIVAMEDWKFFHKENDYEAFLKNRKNAKERHAVKLYCFWTVIDIKVKRTPEI